MLLDKGKSKKYNKKYNIIIVIVAIVILIYIMSSIISLIKSPTDVFAIEYGKISLEDSAIGYIIREETVVKGSNTQNELIQIKSEGEKVAKGEKLFRYYSSNEEEITNQIKQIDAKINEQLESQTEVSSLDIKYLDKQIEQRIEGLNSYTDTEKIREYKNDITTYLTKKSKIIGESSKSGSAIKQLYEERSMYETKLNQTTEYVTAPQSGIVSYRIDNLENILTPTDFSRINEDLLESLNLKTGQIIATNNQSGKVINNFECYIATIMNTENAVKSSVGDKVKIRLSNKDEVNATIEYKAKEEDSNNFVIIFRITSDVEDLTSYRKISFDVIWWSNTGLKVPNSAIIYDDNDLAYIIRNRAGYLDKILIKKMRETKSYTIVQNYETEELKTLGFSTEEIKKMKNVSLYDEIISNPKKEMLQ